MSKTKEIGGWVYLSDNQFMSGILPDNFSEMGEKVAKARLIIDIPEKTLTITETDFIKAIEKASVSSIKDRPKRREHRSFWAYVQDELFGKDS